MPQTGQKHTKIIPMFDEHRGVTVNDIYVDGQWIGSRRTANQVYQAIAAYEFDKEKYLKKYIIRSKNDCYLFDCRRS